MPPVQHAPLTREDAERLGYELRVHGEEGHAYMTGRLVCSVTSRTPLFALLAQIAEREGRPFTANHGGHLEITPELVKQVSGERYKPDPAPEPEPTLQERVAQLHEDVAAILDDPDLPQEEKNTQVAERNRELAELLRQ